MSDKKFKKYKQEKFYVSMSYDGITYGSYEDPINVKCNITLMQPGIYNDDFFSKDVLEEYISPPLPIPMTWQHVSHNLYKDHELYCDECIGNVFDVSKKEYSEGICGTAVLNIPAMRRKVPDHLVNMLLDGEPLGVSIGIYGTFEPIEYGNKLVEKVIDFIIDHVAILDQNEGSCSLKDGCGINKDDKKFKEKKFMLSKARTPAYDGTEEISWGDVKKTVGDYVKGYYKFSGTNEPDNIPTQVKDFPAAMKNWIASKTLLGDSNANNGRDLIFFPVVNPETDKLNYGALLAVKSGRGQSANIPENTLKTAIDKANYLLDNEFNKDFSSNKSGDKNMSDDKKKVDDVTKDDDVINDDKASFDKKDDVKDDKPVKKDVDKKNTEFSDEDIAFYKEMRKEKINFIIEKVFNNEMSAEKTGVDKLSLVVLDKIVNKFKEFEHQKDPVSPDDNKDTDDKKADFADDVNYSRGMKKGDSGKSKDIDEKVPEMPKMPWLTKK